MSLLCPEVWTQVRHLRCISIRAVEGNGYSPACSPQLHLRQNELMKTAALVNQQNSMEGEMESTREIYWNVGHGIATLAPMYLLALAALGLLVYDVAAGEGVPER